MDKLDTPHLRCKACDNSECGAILDKSQFRRCSKCKSSYYCSHECQDSDWQHGRHRLICNAMKILSLTDGTRLCSSNSIRERSFMRAILHNDYHESIRGIYEGQVKFMAAHPDSGPFFTLFDYTVIPMRSSIESVAAWPLTTALDGVGPEWKDMVERSARSGGRIQLHVMRVPSPPKPRFWLVPLRSTSGRMQEQFRQLAASLPPESTDLNLTHGVAAILEDNQCGRNSLN
ncbi:hypothetical protein C8R43DRAFT_640269 [Mycena crocata]|nr:hypothetical protein C8R43DRAFT_640269 [Mycena crocata]